MGENGSGTSTLLRVLCWQIAADAGEVEHRGSLGHCPQEAVPNEALTVEQHLRWFQRAYRLQSTVRAEELLEDCISPSTGTCEWSGSVAAPGRS
ncbi:ATP-binding cassette domain-containing protein [Streptomyces sp. NPDC051211]|uniref:ATP-binding cassette domain-containing protein n=1 Tax=Streptomyces sp. NPDC051211 TaxID=3154643 RepID=UPI00344D14C7